MTFSRNPPLFKATSTFPVTKNRPAMLYLTPKEPLLWL